ncbi:MAG: acyl-CoA dehydrogenase family protein [Acidimicrobiales bacterium]|jgi:alkylation response protein AidB-like acyl-CoA dehydrogenase|nr:acyl-CoA dehydrogenase family protein [Acidimicrobiales bacterium]
MSDIVETAEQASYRAEVRAWYDTNATPKKPDHPWATNIHIDPNAAARHFENSKSWLGVLHAAGYSGIAWPAEYGGGGGESWMTRIEREIAGDYQEWTGFPGSTIAMLGPTLMRHGTEEQKKEFIPTLLSGERTFCQLFSEPGAGSDLASLGTKAVLDGSPDDGEFVVNGQKVWNSSAQYTDWGFILVRTDPDAPKHKGITFLLVDMSTPGVEVRPLVQINRSAHFNEVFFNDVRIPAANVVGEINEGWGPARTVLSNESAFIAGTRISTADKLRALATERGVTGDPVIRQELVRYLASERISGWMGEQVQQAVRRGEMPPMDPGLIKLRASNNKRLAGDLAMTIMGAAATASEPGGADAAQTFWAQAESMGRYSISIGGGTDQVLKNNIGERSLGLPREPGYDKNQAWKDIPK